MQQEQIMKRLQREINFTAMRALNATVAEMALYRYPNLVQEVFDRPNPWIMRGFRYKKAERDNLVAEVSVSDDRPVGPTPRHVLSASVFGGARKPKRFELALRAKGVLPSNQYAVPGRDAKIDSYGNMSGSQIVQILSALGAFSESGYTANRTARSAARKKNPMNLFVIKEIGKGLAPGIYQRINSGLGVKQLLRFVKQPIYEERFNFYKYGEQLLPRLVLTNFERYFQR